MNVNIEKTQIFHQMKYDLKGHSRSHKMTFLFKDTLFLGYISDLKSNRQSLKTFIIVSNQVTKFFSC